MPSCHILQSRPSSLLVLICLSIVRRARPDWVAVSMREAARAEGVNAERVSRLTTRVLAGFEALVSGLTRMGRPRKDATSTCGDNATANSELALTCGLMDVAASILRNVSLRKDAIRALIVGAYLRLRQEHPQLTQKRFCEALAVPERTLRTWLKHSHVNDNRSPVTEPKKPRRTRRRRPRRPRFGFDVTIPDDQFAADTTELRAFGLRLKLIATQDVGGRDQSLLDAIIVDDHESADLVVKVITKSLAERPGAQLLSDQGTPYLATTTRQALEQLQAEHAVQKEGHPQGKATLERAFGTIKHIAGPILSLTNRLASTLDGLAQPDLAIAASTLLLTALLRAYQAGARASRRACPERPVDPDELKRVAEQSRERARADNHSARLLLARIHGAYDIDCPLRDFVRQFRCRPVAALRQAECTFARQAHRTDIRNRKAYFGRLVDIAHRDHRGQQAKKWRQQQHDQRLEQHHRRVEAERAAWHANPAKWLRDCLDLVAQQWTGTTLLMDGAGVSTWMRQSLARLTELHGPLVTELVAGVFRGFEKTHLSKLGHNGITAVRAILLRHRDEIPMPTNAPSSVAQFAATLLATGSIPRPPPSPNPC